MTNSNDRPKTTEGLISCREIQGLLFEYMTRELGGRRSDVVREHLRKCSACQGAATELQATLDMLNSGSSTWPPGPERLSDERRARIVFAFMHPFLDWVYNRHRLVSIVITIVTLTLLLGALYRVKIWRTGLVERGVQVVIGERPAAGDGSTNRTPHQAPNPPE